MKDKKERKNMHEGKSETEQISHDDKGKGGAGCYCEECHSGGEFNLKKHLAFIIPAVILVITGLIFQETLQRTPFGWAEYAVFIAAYLLSGWRVLLTTARNFAHARYFDEYSLMSIATLGAFAIHQLPEAVGVMLFFQIGELFQELSVSRSRRSIRSLLAVRPEYARLIRGKETQVVSPENVNIGDIILVQPGEKIPLDGEIISGTATMDTAPLTGESLPRYVGTGETGTFMTPGKTTLATYLERWLKDYAFPNLAPRTAQVYEYIVRIHLIPSLGHVLLTQLKPEHLQKYYANKLSHGRSDGKGGLSSKSVSNHHMVIHCALQIAVKWGLLQRNPADAVNPPRIQKREITIWDENEIRRFLEATSNSPYYPVFYLALFTGLRRSELLALRWQDVDFIYCQIYVSRSVHHLRNGQIIYKDPKSARGNRTVAVHTGSTQRTSEETGSRRFDTGTTAAGDRPDIQPHRWQPPDS